MYFEQERITPPTSFINITWHVAFPESSKSLFGGEGGGGGLGTYVFKSVLIFPSIFYKFPNRYGPYI